MGLPNGKIFSRKHYMDRLLPNPLSINRETWAIRLPQSDPLQLWPKRRLLLRSPIVSPICLWHRDRQSIFKPLDLHLFKGNGHSNSLNRPHIQIHSPIQIVTHNSNKPFVLSLLSIPTYGKTPAHDLFNLEPSLANWLQKWSIFKRQRVRCYLFFKSEQRVAITIIDFIRNDILDW